MDLVYVFIFLMIGVLSFGTMQYKKENYKTTIILSFLFGIFLTLFVILTTILYLYKSKDSEPQKENILQTNKTYYNDRYV